MTSLYAGVGHCLLEDVATEETGVHLAVFCFPEHFIGFSGHFPGNPVLPGIAQMMAVQITAAGKGKTAGLVQVKRCKFLRPVKPDEHMQVRISLGAQGSLYMAKAQLAVNDEPCAAMSLLLDISPYNKSA